MEARQGVAKELARLRPAPGVYLLADLDDLPLYVGLSRDIRSRLQQHFLRQDSSAVADGLLDPFDVLTIHVWYANEETLPELEAQLFQRFQPRWNRAALNVADPLSITSPDAADDLITLIDGTELASRRDPLRRVEMKLHHLVRAVRKAQVSGASNATKKALWRHADELTEFLRRLE